MSNSWDEMRKAKEDSYFAKKDQEALERLGKMTTSEKPRMSPITGEPMEKFTLNGVVIDRCPKSGGVWLDAGELEQLMQIATDQQSPDAAQEGWLQGFFRALATPQKKGL